MIKKPHNSLTQTIVASSNPYIELFKEVRDSSIQNSEYLTSSINKSSDINLQNQIENINETITNFKLSHNIFENTCKCIQNFLMNKANSIPNADLFIHPESSESESKDDDEWEDI